MPGCEDHRCYRIIGDASGLPFHGIEDTGADRSIPAPQNTRERAGPTLLSEGTTDAQDSSAPSMLRMLGGGFAQACLHEYDPEGFERAFARYGSAAEQGSAEAQRELAHFYFIRDSRHYDPEVGIRWLSAAAEQGDLEAAELLVRFLLYREDVPEDNPAALGWVLILQQSGRTDLFDADELAFDRETLESILTSGERTAAARLAESWTPAIATKAP
jgi:TPR repeat protein